MALEEVQVHISYCVTFFVAVPNRVVFPFSVARHTTVEPSHDRHVRHDDRLGIRRKLGELYDIVLPTLNR